MVNSNLKQEMKRNSDIFASNLNLQPSDTALFINGMYYDIDLIDIFGILDVLRQELSTMEGLHKIGNYKIILVETFLKIFGSIFET